MLRRLMRRFLTGHGRALALVMAFTVGQVVCQLLLPSLNADIINKGILAGDSHYIWVKGAEMLVVTLIQAGLAVAAVYFASRVAMAVGRDIRGALFHRVTDFSAQDVARFGAPSLITRITNDVSQVQILTLMMGTLFLAAPITIVVGIFMAAREDVPLTAIFLVSVPLVVIVVGGWFAAAPKRVVVKPPAAALDFPPQGVPGAEPVTMTSEPVTPGVTVPVANQPPLPGAASPSVTGAPGASVTVGVTPGPAPAPSSVPLPAPALRVEPPAPARN